MVYDNKKSYKFLFKPLFFIFSLIIASVVILYIEKLKPSDLGHLEGLFTKDDEIIKRKDYPIKPPQGFLTSEEVFFARIAWKYFENNYHEPTGFVNGKDNCPVFNLKDLTDYLMGMISAYEIGIVDSLEVDRRMLKLMLTLSEMELYEEKLPNERYHVVSGKMLDGNNEISEEGTGWSARDIGRFFSFVNKIVFDYPQYQNLLKRVLSKWKINEMLYEGYLSEYVGESEKRLMPTVRLGYEEYCSKNLFKAGFDASSGLKYYGFIKFVDLYGERIAVDRREIRNKFNYNFIQSEPYVLDGLEYGWDLNSRELAYRIFKVQKERYLREDILTAVSEDFVDQPPYYVYNSIYGNFNQWVCYDEKGKKKQDLKTISTKIAFAWHALYDDEYSERLFDAVKDLYDPDRGWYSGIYEKTGKTNKVISCNTNGIILESFNYKLNGRLIKFE
jgi:hypothetical protein